MTTRAKTPRRDRRSFLKGAAVAATATTAAAVGAAAVAGTETGNAEVAESAKPEHTGYRETEHVRTYYRLARF